MAACGLTQRLNPGHLDGRHLALRHLFFLDFAVINVADPYVFLYYHRSSEMLSELSRFHWRIRGVHQKIFKF